jgi:hypothetical protein
MRKRSKYRPKGVRPDAIAYVLSGIRPFAKVPYGTTLRIKNHDALDKLRRGEADREVIDVLIGAYNVTEGLVRQGIGAEYSAEIRAGQDALLAVAKRERFILKPEELNALNLAMEVHDAQLDVCTVVELERAIDIVQEDVIHKRARSIR